MTEPAKTSALGEADRFLGIYLRDHLAGSVAGLALVRRCREENAGTSLEADLRAIESEIAEDRDSLVAIMGRLGVSPSAFKAVVGSLAEKVGRLKTNGRLFRYSPLSRVVELEGLAAGIATKRNLWRSLRVVADAHAELDAAELEALIGRATRQLERVRDAHAAAAAEAFAG